MSNGRLSAQQSHCTYTYLPVSFGLDPEVPGEGPGREIH